MKSAMGAVNRMPVRPKNRGKISSRGTRKNTCRVRDSSTPRMGLPMAAKKLEDSSCTQLTTTMNR